MKIKKIYFMCCVSPVTCIAYPTAVMFKPSMARRKKTFGDMAARGLVIDIYLYITFLADFFRFFLYKNR